MIKGTVTAKPQVFAAAVKWAAKFVVGKPSVPIQGGLHLIADHGSLTIEAFNENVSARAVVPVEGDGAGEVTVSGRLLDALVGTFPDKPVQLGGDDDDTLTIAAGRWNGALPVMDADAFPALAAEPPAWGTAPGEALADAIARVAPAASTDLSTRVAMACLLLSFGDGAVQVVATDSLRAAKHSAPYYGATGLAIVLAQTMNDVAAAFIGPDDIAIGLDEHSISLTSATRSVVLRQVNATNEWDGMIGPLDHHLSTQYPQHAVVKVADLLGPMKRAALVRDKDGPIRLSFAPDLISVFAKAEQIHQKGVEEVDAQYDGPEHAAAFNPKFLADALAGAPSDEVELGFEVTGPAERPKPIVVTVAGNDAWRHLLMPIRLRD